MFKDRENQRGLYQPIHNTVVGGDACNLDPQLVKDMPLNAAANFKVEIIDQKNQTKCFELQLSKRPQPPIYEQILRVIPKDGQYRMEALEHDSKFLKYVLNLKGVSFAKEITPLSRVLSFDIISKVNGVHHPAFRAKKFIPWSFQCLNGQESFTHIFVDFELGSDTYQKFLEDLKKCDGNTLEAMKHAYSHQIKIDLGFELNPEFVHHVNERKPCVLALYSRVGNSE